jgi:hypothetical protein
VVGLCMCSGTDGTIPGVGAGGRDVEFAAHNVLIHFSTVFDGRIPVLCGASGTPCPASNERRYVSCPQCVARLGPVVVHARRSDTLRQGARRSR